MSKCSICEAPYSGFGHNAWPVNGRRCCDDCNEKVVIPARFRAFTAENHVVVEEPDCVTVISLERS
jgi:hypothetical protein